MTRPALRQVAKRERAEADAALALAAAAQERAATARLRWSDQIVKELGWRWLRISRARYTRREHLSPVFPRPFPVCVFSLRFVALKPPTALGSGAARRTAEMEGAVGNMMTLVRVERQQHLKERRAFLALKQGLSSMFQFAAKRFAKKWEDRAHVKVFAARALSRAVCTRAHARACRTRAALACC